MQVCAVHNPTMRLTIRFFALLLGWSALAHAERKHSVSLEVKVVRSGASTERFETANVDRVNAIRSRKTVVFQREKTGVLDLAVAVRNFAKAPDALKIDWLFFAQELGSSTVLPLSEGEKTVLLKPGATEQIKASAERATSIESKRWEIDRVELQNRRVEAPVSHEHAKVGVKIVGWIVRAVDEDEVIAFRASSARFERYATGEARNALLAEAGAKGKAAR